MSFETTPIEENERSTVCCYKWDNHTVMARVLCQMALQHFQSQYLHEKYGTLLCHSNQQQRGGNDWRNPLGPISVATLP